MTEGQRKQAICKVVLCGKPQQARGYCNSHYHRLRRYGRAEYRPSNQLSGGVDRSLYLVWHSMINRCHNTNTKSYRNYGARGVKVCNRWRSSYRQFVSDIGPRPTPSMTIDRINNDGDYEPGNVRWATRLEQARNSTSVRWLTHDGRKQTIADWTRERGFGKGTISDRLLAGWSVAEAIDTPKGGRRLGTA